MEQSNELFSLNLDPQNKTFLAETAKWAKFLAIIGFIFIALIVLVGIFAGTLMATTFDATGMLSGGFFTFFYILMSLIYFFPCWYLYKFASSMQNALKLDDQQQLTTSFMNLKSCFKFVGIFTIVILSIYGLFLLIALFTGLGAAFM